MSNILVIGASGTVGSELSRLLQARGHHVARATSQAPQASDQVQLNLATGQGLGEALAGRDAVFLLNPPGHTRQHEWLVPVIDRAKALGVPKLVLMTAMGANADETAPLRIAERHLEASGLAYNIIRPNWFMQNFHTFWLQGIREQGKIFLPVGQAKGSFIDARDIAAVAAVLLTSPQWDNQDFDLTGAEALNHDEVATLLSRATDRAIAFEDVTPEAMRPKLLAAGLPPDYVEFLLLILGFFKAGYSERTTDAVQAITGQAPRRFEAYAQEYRHHWLA